MSKIKRFTLNGSDPQTLKDIFREVVNDFAKKHPLLDAQQIRDLFVTVCKGVKVPHIVETEPEYHLRDGQKSQKRTVEEIILPNGEKLYVTNQWRAGKPGDNFFQLKDVVHAMGWGKIV
jgi:hypothetical protein